VIVVLDFFLFLYSRRLRHSFLDLPAERINRGVFVRPDKPKSFRLLGSSFVERDCKVLADGTTPSPTDYVFGVKTLKILHGPMDSFQCPNQSIPLRGADLRVEQRPIFVRGGL